MLASAALLLMSEQLTKLAPVDILILAMYFVLVVFIGFYAKGKANTSEDFFLAGREMTAWIAGLSFVSANLGSLELMGWAGAAYEYGILATHWYWIGAIPAMLFLGIVMMPFYYISKTHSVPGYLHLRFGEGARGVSAISFALMTILMSGVNMYAMAVVMQTVLGWDINFSIVVGAATVALYVMLGGLRSAIINEVLQFVLIWAGAAMIPILGLIEAGGWSNLKAQIANNVHNANYTHLWTTLGHFKDNPMGVHWTGHCLRAWICRELRILDHGLPCGPARVEREQPARGQDGSGDRRGVQDGGAADRDCAGVDRAGPAQCRRQHGVSPGERRRREGDRPEQLRRGAAADADPLLRAGPAGAGDHGTGGGLYERHGGQSSAFSTVWTYDIYGAFLNKKASDSHYVAMGRWSTGVGMLVSIASAYLLTHATGIMDYVQALFSFFIAPLFGTVVLGMLWKRATKAGGFWGC